MNLLKCAKEALVMFCQIGTVVLLSMPASAFSPGATALSAFETRGNPLFEQDDSVVDIEHLEIPLNEVGVDFAKRMSPGIAQSLIVTGGDGKVYVRWILHPDDSKWGQKVAQHFAKKGIKLERKSYFKGYRMASRSILIEDPQTGTQFSVKGSTDRVGPNRANKKQSVGEARDARSMADYIHRIREKQDFKHLAVMDETGALMLPELDQAVIVRELGELSNQEGKKYYLPGFAALHHYVGAKIAEQNGSEDFNHYWTENYLKPVARALAELAVRTGLQHDSPHSQNFLIECDENMRPTGRIVMRDLSDLFIDKKLLRKLTRDSHRILKRFTQSKSIFDAIILRFDLLLILGNRAGNWVKHAARMAWKDIYYEEFEKTIVELTGIPVETLSRERRVPKSRSGEVFYHLANIPEMNPYFESLSNPKRARNSSANSAKQAKSSQEQKGAQAAPVVKKPRASRTRSRGLLCESLFS